MKKASGALYVAAHLVWSFLLAVSCGVKFVWFYDWAPVQDWINTGAAVMLAAVELAAFYKAKQTRECKLSANRGLLCFDILICVFLAAVPPLAGKLTGDYIVWNIFIPLLIFAATALIRDRLARTSSDSNVGRRP